MLEPFRSRAEQDLQQLLTRQPLHGFANRRAADPETGTQLRLGYQRTGRKLQRGDHFFELPIGLFGQTREIVCSRRSSQLALTIENLQMR
jgi:hypothetical protein